MRFFSSYSPSTRSNSPENTIDVNQSLFFYHSHLPLQQKTDEICQLLSSEGARTEAISRSPARTQDNSDWQIWGSAKICGWFFSSCPLATQQYTFFRKCNLRKSAVGLISSCPVSTQRYTFFQKMQSAKICGWFNLILPSLHSTIYFFSENAICENLRLVLSHPAQSPLNDILFFQKMQSAKICGWFYPILPTCHSAINFPSKKLRSKASVRKNSRDPFTPPNIVYPNKPYAATQGVVYFQN
ncbi:hypothetical protein McpSp1_10710 [Methanocorpusculaceae archaeon Sp1]|nr:hypothetical protein [Methanocorpusculaceae archaeon Sp1]